MAEGRHDEGQEGATRCSNQSHQLSKIWHLDYNEASEQDDEQAHPRGVEGPGQLQLLGQDGEHGEQHDGVREEQTKPSNHILKH